MVLDTGNILCSHHHQPSHNSFHLVNWELSSRNINSLSSPLPAPGIHHSTSCLYNVGYSKCLAHFFFNHQIILLLFSRSLSDSLRLHGLQHASLPCPSVSPRACSNSCPLSWWWHPTISPSTSPFFSHGKPLTEPLVIRQGSWFESWGSSKGPQPGELGSSFLQPVKSPLGSLSFPLYFDAAGFSFSVHGVAKSQIQLSD